MKKKACCFFGNKKIKASKKLEIKIDMLIEELLNQNFFRFLFVGRGEFNRYCRNAVLKAKMSGKNVESIFFQSYFVSEELDRHLLEYYDRVLTEKYEDAKEFALIASCQDMIDHSDLVVMYFDRENLDKESCMAFLYAKKKKKEIVNVFYL